MTKAEIVENVSEQTGLSKRKTQKALNAFLNVVQEELTDGGKLALPGFGTFDTGRRRARNGRNPRTGEALVIPAVKTARFKAGKQLKEAVQ